MNRPELYKKTVDILYQAYFDDTLRHGNCHACAVGNIVAANMGFKYKTYRGLYGISICYDFPDDRVNIHWNVAHPLARLGWPSAFFTAGDYQSFGEVDESGRLQIESTGYSIDELAQIEFAFEVADKGLSDDEYMFNGLSAVLDILARIHEVTDQDLITTTSKRFSDHYKSRSVCPATNAT